MQSTSQTDFLCLTLILTSHPCLGLASRFFPLGFPSKTLYAHLPHSCYMYRPYPMKLLIIRYTLTKIIVQSVADHNCDLRSTAVYFTSAATEASNKTFHWLIAFHPNLTCPVVLHIFHYISLVPNFSRISLSYRSTFLIYAFQLHKYSSFCTLLHSSLQTHSPLSDGRQYGDSRYCSLF